MCLATIAAAQVAVERDDLHLALRLLDEADPAMICPLPGEPDIAVLLAMARARAALAEGDPERAGDLARLAREKFEKGGQVLSVLDVEIALRAGDLGVAAADLLYGQHVRAQLADGRHDLLVVRHAGRRVG